MRKLAMLLSLLVLGALGTGGCGGGDDETTAASESETTAMAPPVANNQLSDEETIEQQGNVWAVEFAKDGPVSCYSLGQPACERANCERVPNEPIENCAPPSAEFRESFADATVERVAITGNDAVAEFSNGESVEFEGQLAVGGGTVEHSAWYIPVRWFKQVAPEP